MPEAAHIISVPVLTKEGYPESWDHPGGDTRGTSFLSWLRSLGLAEAREEPNEPRRILRERRVLNLRFRDVIRDYRDHRLPALLSCGQFFSYLQHREEGKKKLVPHGCRDLHFCDWCAGAEAEAIASDARAVWSDLLESLDGRMVPGESEPVVVDQNHLAKTIDFTIPGDVSLRIGNLLVYEPDTGRRIMNDLGAAVDRVLRTFYVGRWSRVRAQLAESRARWRRVRADLSEALKQIPRGGAGRELRAEVRRVMKSRQKAWRGLRDRLREKIEEERTWQIGYVKAMHHWASGNPFNDHVHIHVTIFPFMLKYSLEGERPKQKAEIEGVRCLPAQEPQERLDLLGDLWGVEARAVLAVHGIDMGAVNNPEQGFRGLPWWIEIEYAVRALLADKKGIRQADVKDEDVQARADELREKIDSGEVFGRRRTRGQNPDQSAGQTKAGRSRGGVFEAHSGRLKAGPGGASTEGRTADQTGDQIYEVYMPKWRQDVTDQQCWRVFGIARVAHRLRYAFRSWIYDASRCLQHSVVDKSGQSKPSWRIRAKKRKREPELDPAGENQNEETLIRPYEIGRAIRREESLHGFRRIRWAGFLSTAARRPVLTALGFKAEDKGKQWQTLGVLKLRRITTAGHFVLVPCMRDPENLKRYIVDPGGSVRVMPADMVDRRPINVCGVRKRWRLKRESDAAGPEQRAGPVRTHSPPEGRSQLSLWLGAGDGVGVL